MRSEIAPPMGSQMKLERPAQSVTIMASSGERPQRLGSEGRRVDGDGVERGRGQDRHHDADGHDLPIGAEDRQHLARLGRRLRMLEGFGFFEERAAEPEDERDDQATDQERHAPAPERHLLGRPTLRKGFR